MNIYLIGYRCTGKTTAGRLLAYGIGWEFVDSDQRIIGTAGKSIKQIVEEAGWEEFRQLEASVIGKICEMSATVVATGGGVVLNDENVRQMKRSGWVVWLKASPETITDRIRLDANTEDLRPSLTSKGIFEEISETLENRYPLYENAMDFDVDTDHRSVQSVSDIILDEMNKRGHLL